MNACLPGRYLVLLIGVRSYLRQDDGFTIYGIRYTQASFTHASSL